MIWHVYALPPLGVREPASCVLYVPPYAYQPQACRTRRLPCGAPQLPLAPQVPSKEGAVAVREAARAMHNLSPLPPLVLQADGQVRCNCLCLA